MNFNANNATMRNRSFGFYILTELLEHASDVFVNFWLNDFGLNKPRDHTFQYS